MKKNVPLSPLLTCGITVIVVAALFHSIQAQPVFLRFSSSQSKNFITVGNSLYYSAQDSVWRSQGTPASTQLVKTLGEPIVRMSNKTVNGYFFIVTQVPGGERLWRSDGTAANTISISDTFIRIEPMMAYNGVLYLRINSAIYGQELWKYDGTTLSIVKDINPGAGHGLSHEIFTSNNVIYFKAHPDTGGYLWKTDGTASGTVVAIDLDDRYYSNFTDVNGTIFFSRTTSGGWYYDNIAELWKGNGEDGTMELVKAFEEDQYNTLHTFRVLNGKVYFIRDHSTPHHDLMVSDGTEEGTTLVKRVGIDGDILKMITVNNRLVMYGQTQSWPGPIQVSDGTTEGTYSIHQLSGRYTVGNLYDPVNLTDASPFLFFADDIPDGSYIPANEEDYLEIHQSDLTSGNTKPLQEIFGTSFDGTNNIVSAGHTVYFTTTSTSNITRVWFYDPMGTVVACEGTGSLQREVWTSIRGSAVSQIPLHLTPAQTQTLTSFEAPQNAGDNYGARMRGYLCVKQSGSYRFWIASNDHSELWLSTDRSPGNKQRIAYVNGATNPRQYNKYASQQSALIHLEEGMQYYIEALHKEGVGTDHLSVGMQLPDGTLLRPIDGAYLIPYEGVMNELPVVELTSPAAGQEFFDSPITISLTANASDADGAITRVEFYNGAIKIGETTTAPYQFSWLNVTAGYYTVTARAHDNNGAVVSSTPVNITVYNECRASGTISHEIWWNARGGMVADIPVSRTPSVINQLNSFEAPSNIGVHYGARVRGYVCVPYTGPYTFSIASNDHSELWLSTNDNPSNKRLIAYVYGSTAEHQYDRYPSQRSGTIWLTRGSRYYIEALHKQGVGTDHLSVRWMRGGLTEDPIPGQYLSPYTPTSTLALSNETDAAMYYPETNSTVFLSPNPSEAGTVTLHLNGLIDENDPVKRIDVNIIGATGVIVDSKPLFCAGNCETAELDTRNLTPGLYLINGTTRTKRFVQKLIIK